MFCIKSITGIRNVFLFRIITPNLVSMTWKQVFSSSIGRKLTMGLTGIFLITFLLVHVGINACMWAPLYDANDHGEMFNKAANFMGSMVVIRIIEIGLFLLIFLHIIQGLLLTAYNRSKRSIDYAVNYGNNGSKWYSRSMGLLGTLILLFLILHWIHFWVPSRFGGHFGVHELTTVEYNGIEYHNLFAEMQTVFQSAWVVIVYVLACISLGYHLAHGFQSAFRTMGVHNKRYNAMLTAFGYGFSIIVPFVFAMMPITMYLNLVH